MGEFGRRILFAIPAAAAFIWIAWIGGLWFTGLMVLIACAVVIEMGLLFHHIHLSPAKWVRLSIPFIVIATVVSIAIGVGFDVEMSIAVLYTALVLLYGVYQGRKADRWLSLLLTAVYAPTAFWLAVSIRDSGTPEDGFFLIMALFMGIWGNDVFAYLGGKQFGRHKLAPSISPGKTWEGWAFGFLGAGVGWGLVLLAANRFTSDMQPSELDLAPTWPIIFIISVLGPLGDLMESRLKRRSGKKDSASILPGHGGFFDRFDAMILVTPAVWVFLQWLGII